MNNMTPIHVSLNQIEESLTVKKFVEMQKKADEEAKELVAKFMSLFDDDEEIPLDIE